MFKKVMKNLVLGVAALFLTASVASLSTSSQVNVVNNRVDKSMQFMEKMPRISFLRENPMVMKLKNRLEKKHSGKKLPVRTHTERLQVLEKINFVPVNKHFKTLLEYVREKNVNSQSETAEETLLKGMLSNTMKVITVDDEGDGDYTCIQDAVDNANDGDRIRVYSGFYQEDVIVYKEVTIEGVPRELGEGDDAGRPIIKGETWGIPPVEIAADNTKLIGFKLQSVVFCVVPYDCILFYSSNNTICNCNFKYGILIYGNASSHFIHNLYANTVNGRPLLYYKNEENIILDGVEAGQIILANCSNFELRNIEMNGAGTSIGVEIACSDAVVVHNCSFSGMSNGLYLIRSSNCVISNCSTYFSLYGIRLRESSNNTVSNCVIDWNLYSGVELVSSSNNKILGCNICSRGESYYGHILLESSSGNTISGCNVSNGELGVNVYYSSNNKIFGCNISDNSDGLSLDHSLNNTIHDCFFINNGITIKGDLSHFVQNNIYNNFVNGKPLLYYKNQRNVVIDGNAGQVILANCSGIQVRNISIAHTDIGMEIAFSNVKIYNCNVSNSDIGITFLESSNNTVSNCNVLNNFEGIKLVHSQTNVIFKCNILKNFRGIYFDSSPNNKIFDCKISNSSGEGIWLSRSPNNMVLDCEISNSWGKGIWLSSSSNKIFNCSIINNDEGIFIASSDTEVSSCYISKNRCGIYVFGEGNIIHHNIFVGNMKNAGSYSRFYNQWDDGINEGNYWDDYNGSDENGDGIGDTPYLFYGGKDRYPLIYKPSYPDLNPPELSIEKPYQGYLHLFNRYFIPTYSGETVILSINGVDIEVKTRDHEGRVNHVEFYIDDSKIEDVYYEPGQVSCGWCWDENVFGKHTVKVVAYDLAGNTATKEIKVAIFNIRL